MKIPRMLRLGWQGAKMTRHMLYDLRRYFQAAATEARRLSDAQLQARLLQKAHSIEKGLALPDVRPGFGRAALLELQQLMVMHQARSLSPSDPACQSARHALGAYLSFHADRQWALPSDLQFVERLAATPHASDWGGWVDRHACETRAAARGDFLSLTQARRSTRMFAPETPDVSLIEAAVVLAGRSPSVCNRQGGRARIVLNPGLMRQVLEVQGGNRGFTDDIPALVVVSCHVGVFRGARERNQCWIDGGLFSMSLLYALTYHGLATCPLNWSADRAQDGKLRHLLELPDDEVVVMLVAVGHWRDQYRVATSARLSQDTLLPRIYA